HNAVGQQQPTYYPTYWPTYTPTAADDDAAEYGQEKAVQDETTWIDWAKWHADLKAMISGSGSSGGGDEGGNDDDDNGDKSIGGWPTYEPTYYPTYEPTHYHNDRTLSDSSSSNNNNNQGNDGQDNNNNVPSPTYYPTYAPTTYEPTTMEDRTLQGNTYYGRPPPNTGVYNAYDGVTVTLVTAVIVSVTFLFV
ncbi:hypothetical protein ACHAWC_000303, partial [Mediolabrus comicus]